MKIGLDLLDEQNEINRAICDLQSFFDQQSDNEYFNENDTRDLIDITSVLVDRIGKLEELLIRVYPITKDYALQKYFGMVKQ